MEKIANRGQGAILALYILLATLPLALGLSYSLLYSLGLAGALGKGFTLEHWTALWQLNGAWRSLAYSTYLAFTSLFFSALLGIWLAYMAFSMGERFQGIRFLAMPLTMPPLLASFSIFYLLSPSGLLSRLAFHAGWVEGLEAFPRLVNDAGSVGVLITHIFLVAPFFGMYFFQIAQKEQLWSAKAMAYTLGASPWQFIKMVFVPMLLQKAQSMLVLYGIFLFGTYEVPLLLGRQSPQAVSVFIIEKTSKFDLHHIPVGHAMAVVYTIMIGVLAAWLLKKRD